MSLDIHPSLLVRPILIADKHASPSHLASLIGIAYMHVTGTDKITITVDATKYTKIHRILFAPRRERRVITVISTYGNGYLITWTHTNSSQIYTHREKTTEVLLYLVTIDIKAAFTHNRLKIEGQPLTLIPSIDSETLGIPGRPLIIARTARLGRNQLYGMR